MLSKENTKEQVTDNQMDYVNAGSARVDYENILSSEELQCGRSQESPRVTRSSSIGSSSTSTDDEEMFSCISITSDEIVKKATFFVETFVKEFEKKIFEYSEEAKPDSKTRKVGKIAGQFASIVNNLIPPNLYRLSFTKAVECMGYVSARRHREKAKSVSLGVVSCKGNRRESLVEAGLEIFQKFEEQFIKIVDVNSSWQRGIEKLAMDAVYRIMDYSSNFSEGKDLFVDFITKGVVLGNSKKRKLSLGDYGYQIKDEQSSKTLMTSDLYTWVGIKKTEDKIVHYYQYGLLEEYDYPEKCSYRPPFVWELEEWKEVEQKYVLVNSPKKEEYAYILDEEKKKKLANSILKEINGNDLTKKKDIEDLREEIKDLRIHHEKEDKNTFSFNLGYLPEFFIKREVMLDELKKKLDSKNQEVEMSRVVLINGKHGTGKSELAKNCVYSKKNDWKKIAWIDATTYSTLSQSFRNLAKELKIPIENDMNLNSVRDREIESIVKDIYQDFRDVKSLFIFDNASEYKEIEKFLPSHFPDLFFRREKPYVLITSRNKKNWKKEIEKIELDNGFSLGEAITFIERTLGIKDRLQNCYLVELAEALDFLPLALAQATACIKQEKIDIIKYLKQYDEAMKGSNLDYFEAQGISPELFTTLKVNFDKIRREKNIGQQSHDIVAYMAYLSPNQIDTAEIFLRKKSEKDKQQVLDIFDLLNKFSVIELEESTVKVHKGIQKTIRVEEELAGTEEETLRGMMTSFCLTNVNHITSIWSHVSKYSKLVNDFIDSIYDEGSTILHLLAKDGNEEVIRLILEKIDPNKFSKVINAVDKENLTALEYAVMHGHSDIVKYLIKKGDGIIDLQNKGAIHWAAKNRDLETVKYLIENGADVNLQNEFGMSPMHWAVDIGDLETIKYLIENGADVNLQDEFGMSPMHWAASICDLEIVKYLIENGANVNLQNEVGVSLMHWAAKNGHLDIVKYLVGKGSNVNLKDIDNNTILDFAVIANHLDIIKYLCELKAKMCQESKDFLYRYAITNHDKSIIYYLMKAQLIVNPLKRKSGTICTQVLMEERPRTLGLQNYTLSDSGKYQYTSSKKRKLENMSATSEENSSNTQLLQGSQDNVNPPSDMSMQFEGLLGGMVNFTNMPISSFNSVSVQPANKDLRL